MSNIDKKIYELGLVPVVVIDDASDAVPLANALIKGGLPVAEVTFRTEAAFDAIKAIKTNFPNMFVGAGTVLTTKQVDDALSAGAEFIVSPGLDENIVKYCQSKNVPIYPGISSASELTKAVSLGLSVVKFFPAEENGGLKMIKAIGAAFPQVKFMPTGGINSENMLEYLKSNKVIACGGSFMVKKDLIKAHEFEEIENMTRNAALKMHNFYFKHVGINCSSKDEANDQADKLNELFGFTKKELSKSYFASDALEFMNNGVMGKHGHIAIACNNVDRAMYYLKNKGIEFDENTIQYNDDGSAKFVYLKEEYNGFRYHLTFGGK